MSRCSPMKRIAMTVCISVLCSTGSSAQPDSTSADERGREIAEEAQRRDEGFGDTVTEITMQLMSTDGRIRERRLSWQTLEVIDDGDKSLTIFHEPRDIAGTAFLSFTHINEPDDQWLYLPALKRVKRIASANQTSSFMGSEFSYEDLLSDEVERFDYRWLRDEVCGELTCFVLERRPRYPDSGYSKQIVWVDQEEYRTLKIEYYDRREDHEKTLSLDSYRQYLGEFWRAHEFRMENHQTQKATLLAFDTYSFQTGLTDRDFDPNALRRLR
jgi:outer membrane lipoprotein-sorting protein